MESKTRLARTPSIGPPLLQEAWRFSKPHRPTPSTRSARSSGDHDVGCRRGAVRLTLACLGVVPPALLLAAEDLEDEADDEEEEADEKPQPAEADVPRVVEQAEEGREEGEDAGGEDDERADEEARETPLALARHGSEERGCQKPGGCAIGRLHHWGTARSGEAARDKPFSQNGLSQ